MKLEELTGVSVEILDALTAEELHNLCAPFFNVTRPELATKPEIKKSKSLTNAEKEEQMKIKMAKQLAFEKLGIKL